MALLPGVPGGICHLALSILPPGNLAHLGRVASKWADKYIRHRASSTCSVSELMFVFWFWFWFWVWSGSGLGLVWVWILVFPGGWRLSF